MGSSSLGTLLGAEADAHDAADDAANDGAAGEDDTDDDEDDDSSGQTTGIDLEGVALTVVADVAEAVGRVGAVLAVAPGANFVVVAHS